MLDNLIPNFDSEADALREVARAGFTVCLNFSISGPEHVHSEYAQDWRQEYESKCYYAMDPVLMWGMTHTGTKRWSEIQLPDVRKVLTRGASFGLNYGAVVAVKKDRMRSFLTLARSDRELTDEEIAQVQITFERWCDVFAATKSK